MGESTYAFTASSNSEHQIKVLNHGQMAFANRLKLIESAKQRISIETFAFEIGPSTRLLVQALLKKAAQGVTVEVLFDKYGTHRPQLSALQELLKARNINFKVFNTKKLQLGFRTHRKLLIVDEEQAIIGGRNLQDKQFERSPELHNLDREVYVRGPIVKDIQKSFDIVFNGTYADDSFLNKKRDEQYSYVYSWFVKTDQDIKYQKELNILFEASEFDSSMQYNGTCQSVTWAASTDKKSFESPANAIYSRLENAKNRIQIESPYFIPSKKQKKIVKKWIEDKMQVEFLTNGAFSSHEFHISLANYDAVKIQKDGFNIRFLNGELPEFREEAPTKMWRLHSKTYVFDETSFAVTSYNWDRRSETINLETAFICDQSNGLSQKISQHLHQQFIGQGTTEDFFANYFKSKSLFFLKRLLVNPLKPIF